MSSGVIPRPPKSRLLPATQREEPASVACPSPIAARPVVDGKFFARGGRRLLLQGVTYGPFASDSSGHPFPAPARVRADLKQMRAAGINAIRTYHVPPPFLLELAAERGLLVLVDIPWPKHLCFLDRAATRREVLHTVRQAARAGRDHLSILGYSVANEIPTDIIRWHGVRRVQGFLAELGDAVKQIDPAALVSYASFPPTEYLDLSAFDFATFNVYLHEREVFSRYLLRLQNLVGDRPLVLGELGMDSLRHGEHGQARFVEGHLREAMLLGVAGAFVFSWTDDWHTGGHAVSDWAFGVTRADRSPKPAYEVLSSQFGQSPTHLLSATPAVSVVVCTYNGGRTLDQCLRSLLALDYPHYEVIVVDDGSTDNTAAILARYPEIRSIAQPNLGLSAARNVGLQAARGSIIAYTDSDCFADPRWLTQLVHRFLTTSAAAVGGPNLTPDDGWLAACVAACPGQPVHVLESDQVAEHIPGCNMAFRREALEAVNGFDPLFRKAGDDVDLCWRLQQAGSWITFAPGAFVWHHRRQGPRTYLRQQAGYGEAEALLGFKHPGKFTRWGNGKWRGVVYGGAPQGLRLGASMIYRGTYGTGLFQCLYQPGPTHWAMLPATLEWHLAAVAVALAGCLWSPLALMAGWMLILSSAVAVCQAWQARLPAKAQGPGARLVVLALCYAQPLIRSGSRYWTRLFGYRAATVGAALPFGRAERLPLSGCTRRRYWSEGAGGRLELLRRVGASLDQHRWGRSVDTGWANWDLEIYCHPHPWTVVRLCTVQEEHGQARRLIGVRFQLRSTFYTQLLIAVGSAAVLAGAWSGAVPVLGGAMVFAFCLLVWYRGTCQAAQVLGLVDEAARALGWIRLEALARPKRLRRWLRNAARLGAAMVNRNHQPVPIENSSPCRTHS